MLRFMVERSLKDTSRRLRRARDELAILEEQIQVFQETADETRLRSLVSETPEAGREAVEARRHADAIDNARSALLRHIKELEARQNALLEQLV
ncbi:MAG: hypothetical protein M1456_04990 [Actinobacteria bacterium]|jgi:hypothetical protein|nr:hypothetical protein [Actinomycetota bacterium]